jgi:hypothetical protein
VHSKGSDREKRRPAASSISFGGASPEAELRARNQVRSIKILATFGSGDGAGAMAASAAFARPFGYQTNVIAYQMGEYRYLDFVRIGLPLNFITMAVAIAVIPFFFPF